MNEECGRLSLIIRRSSIRMSVLLFTTDLMTSSKVDAAARRQGVTLVTVASGTALLEKAGEAGAALVILDLNSPGVDPADLVSKLRGLSAPPRSILAFGPHVHEAKLEAARAAGCDAVISRGQFHAQVDELIAAQDRG